MGTEADEDEGRHALAPEGNGDLSSLSCAPRSIGLVEGANMIAKLVLIVIVGNIGGCTWRISVQSWTAVQRDDPSDVVSIVAGAVPPHADKSWQRATPPPSPPETRWTYANRSLPDIAWQAVVPPRSGDHGSRYPPPVQPCAADRFERARFRDGRNLNSSPPVPGSMANG